MPHNFMIYNGQTLSSTSDFQTSKMTRSPLVWKNLASQFVSNKNVIFDLMNEPHDIPATTVFQMMQAGVNGVRSSGATSQLILVEGTSWTGAWTWTSSGNAAAFAGLKDPNNNVAVQMHQYLDSDGSGTSPTCVSSTIGYERLADATNWLKSTGLKGFLGEMGAGSNPTCITAVSGAICAMQQAAGVFNSSSELFLILPNPPPSYNPERFSGNLNRAAGPWWADYFQSIEPPNGAAISQILPQALKPYL
ncbi:hypothetical protein D9758_003766 [Tetrapyrgos nigripes]|uniref:cellulase n=1 Tax=Tetrapyrgos nigripes TaxID=182062 RepID=A0A8H5LS87_9AGAR|nr:hypothetical protein D9758_003766 [Tetrapyrgos nigripes]